MNARVFLTLRDAVHATATSSKQPMKALAAELDWSPSELSMRVALTGDSARPFPADDEHLVKLMRVTADYSILATLADLCGFEIVPKRERTAEALAGLQADFQAIGQRLQQLSLGLDAPAGKKR